MILRRLPESRFSTVLREWEGGVSVILGGGPSLTPEQVELVRAMHASGRVQCIAVNDAYLLADFAAICYFSDAKWYCWQQKGIAKPDLGFSAEQTLEKWQAFKGQKCSIQSANPYITDEAVHILRNRDFPYHGTGMSDDPGALVTGRNSGHQALNLAVLAGAKKIILLGFDGRPGADGRTHWHGEHPTPTPIAVWQEIRRAFSQAESGIKAAGVRVVNCSPGSFIDTFEKMALEEALA